MAIFLFGAVFFFGVSAVNASILDFIRAFVTINPLAVEVTAPAEADLNRVFKVEANVINKGEVKIENVTGEIFLPAGLTISGKEIKKIGIVPAGREKRVSWSVKGKSIGEGYIIAVSISGAVNGDSVSADGSTVVNIVEKAPLPVRLPGIFQSFFDFIGKWFGR
ncbi:hypothetical protein IIC45_02085 [Patescibacteria group bacterium]|nr:hypothetical protein [Patescibacteria group bacterium]